MSRFRIDTTFEPREEIEVAGFLLKRDVVNHITGEDGSSEKVIHVLCFNVEDRWLGVKEKLRELYGRNVKITFEVVRQAESDSQKPEPKNKDRWVRIYSVLFIGEVCCVALSGDISEWNFTKRKVKLEDGRFKVTSSQIIGGDEEGCVFPESVKKRITGEDGDWKIAGSVTGFNAKNNWKGSSEIIETIYGDENVSGKSWQVIGPPGTGTVMQHGEKWERIRDVFFYKDICHIVGSGKMLTWQFPFRMSGPRPFDSLYGIDPLPYMCM